MKTLFILFYFLSCEIVFGSTDLPRVQAPKELSQSGEYSEGTNTRLTPSDIAQYLSYTQNAKAILEKAMNDSSEMKISDRVDYLKKIIRSVVKSSGEKRYQMFMRFALNRTLLLVEELEKYCDMNQPGVHENALDIVMSGINIALSYYESDLSFQSRSNYGEDSINLPYADFGIRFGKAMLKSQMNILNARAQYRLLYKTLEMINWDLSRDAGAEDMSDFIVQTYNTLTSMNELPEKDTSLVLKNIRRLTLVVQNLPASKKPTLKPAPVPTPAPKPLVNVPPRRPIEPTKTSSMTPDEVRKILSPSGVVIVSDDSLYYLSSETKEARKKECMSLNIPWKTKQSVAAITDHYFFMVDSSEKSNEKNCDMYSENYFYQIRPLTVPVTITGIYKDQVFIMHGSTPSELLVSCYETYSFHKFSTPLHVQLNGRNELIMAPDVNGNYSDASDFCFYLFETMDVAIYKGDLHQ